MPKISIDWKLILPVVFLLLLGLMVLRSVAPDQVFTQIGFVLVSTLFFLFFSQTDYRIFFSLHLPIYVVSLILLLLPFVFGTHSRGALRWLQFGQFNFQPSEFIKPFLLISFAYLATRESVHHYLGSLLVYALPAIIIFVQPDLGTTLVISVAWLTTFLSQIGTKSLVVGVLLLTLLAPLSWFFLKNYQRQRLLTFVNPYADPLGQGYHVIQSITAVGSGEVTGRGLGHGTQSQLQFLPEHHTDFIFASLSEELGLIGSSLTILLYLLLLWRIYHISQTVPDPQAAYFALSCLSMLTFQIFINIGMNMGIAPITGITLPFLSYGGSSLLSLGILTGILSSISTHNSTSAHFSIH